MQSLLHRVRRRRASQTGDAGSRRDAPLPDGTMPARVRDVRLLLRAAGRRSASGPAGQVSSRRETSTPDVYILRMCERVSHHHHMD